MKIGQSITELQNKVIDKILKNQEIVKALIIDNEDFLNITPTAEQNAILEKPNVLIRKQIMPYKNITSVTNIDKPYITSAWVNFKRTSNNYKSGRVYFYIIMPNSLEKTAEGIRYLFIADRLDELLSESGIGRFVFDERGDFPIDKETLGHYIVFNIEDFYGV